MLLNLGARRIHWIDRSSARRDGCRRLLRPCARGGRRHVGATKVAAPSRPTGCACCASTCAGTAAAIRRTAPRRSTSWPATSGSDRRARDRAGPFRRPVDRRHDRPSPGTSPGPEGRLADAVRDRRPPRCPAWRRSGRRGSRRVRAAHSCEPIADGTMERWLSPGFRARDPGRWRQNSRYGRGHPIRPAISAASTRCPTSISPGSCRRCAFPPWRSMARTMWRARRRKISASPRSSRAAGSCPSPAPATSRMWKRRTASTGFCWTGSPRQS